MDRIPPPSTHRPRASGDVAYRVPWSLDVHDGGRCVLRNASDEDATFLTLSSLDSGHLVGPVRAYVPAGGVVTFALHPEDLAIATVLVVRWRRPDGDEYLWRVAF